jgi:hypothetical protein
MRVYEKGRWGGVDGGGRRGGWREGEDFVQDVGFRPEDILSLNRIFFHCF